MSLSSKQLQILETICTDLAKAMFLAAFAAPAIIRTDAFFNTTKAALMACILTFTALKLAQLEEVKRT